MVSTVVLVIAIQILAMLSVLFVYASRYKQVPPDKAMVVYGRQMHPGMKIGYRIITGGGKFLLPVIEDVRYMDLGLKEANLEIDNLRTDPSRGAKPVRIRLTALYGIGDDPSVLHVATEHLLGKTGEDVKRITETLIEGHVRGIAATVPAEEIDLNREEVEKRFVTMARQDLLNIGIDIKAFAIVQVTRKGVS